MKKNDAENGARLNESINERIAREKKAQAGKDLEQAYSDKKHFLDSQKNECRRNRIVKVFAQIISKICKNARTEQ